MTKSSPEPNDSLLLADLERIDELCVTFEVLWQANQNQSIETFLDKVPENQQGQLLYELISIEFDYLKQQGQSIQYDDYRARFSIHADIVERAISDAVPAIEATRLDDRSRAVPAVGQKIRYVGNYEILEEIARGGMGVVYKARQSKLNRIVALKMILSGHFASKEEVVRFLREARAAGNLDHPNVVSIHEMGEFEGRHYFTMDYVDGPSLAERLREETLSPMEAAQLVRSVAETIHFAHQKNTLHRDLKPANILLNRQGIPLITDFGLAKTADDLSGDDGEPIQITMASLTTLGAIGTPSYMSPEQAAGKPKLVGPATDIWALGAILYACLTGRPPFVADNSVDTMLQVMRHEPVSPYLLNPAVPKDLETICLKCLSKEPHERYGTAQLLADDLERFIEGRPVVARPVGRASRFFRLVKRNPIISSLIALAIVLLISGTAVSSYFAVEAEQRATAEKDARLYAQEQEEKAEIALEETRAALERESASLAKAEQQRARAELAQVEASRERRKAIESQKQAEAALIEQERATAEAERAKLIAGRRYYAAQVSLAQQAWQNDDPSRVLQLLETLRPKEDEDDRRTFEWYYLRNLSESKLRFSVKSHIPGSFAFHGEAQGLLKFSDNGKTIAVSDTMGAIRFWDSITGEFRNEIDNLLGSGGSIAFSRDGGLIAQASGNKASIWDAEKRLRMFNCNGECKFVEFSPDEKILATAGRTVQFWEVETGKLKSEISVAGPVQSITFSSDSHKFALTEFRPNSNGKTEVWSITGEPTLLKQLPWSKTVRFVPNKNEIITKGYKGYGKEVLIWDLNTDKKETLYNAELLDDSSLAISSDGNLVAFGTSFGRLVVYDRQTGEHQILAHLQRIGDVVFSPDSNVLASLCGNGDVKIWDLSTPENTTLSQRVGLAWVGRPVAFAPDGKTVAMSSFDGNVEIISIPDGNVIRSLAGPKGAIGTISFSPDGRLIASSRGHWADGKEREPTKVWHTEDGRLAMEFDEADRNWVSVFSPDGATFAIGLGGKEILLFDIETWRLRSVIKSGLAVRSLAFSPDGRSIAATGMPARLRLFDVVSGKLVADHDEETTSARALSFSPDGTAIIIGDELGNIRLRDSKSLRLMREFTGHSTAIESLGFFPDGETLVSAGESAIVKFWDVPTGQERWTSKEAKFFAISPTAEFILTGGGPTGVNLWDGRH